MASVCYKNQASPSNEAAFRCRLISETLSMLTECNSKPSFCFGLGFTFHDLHRCVFEVPWQLRCREPAYAERHVDVAQASATVARAGANLQAGKSLPALRRQVRLPLFLLDSSAAHHLRQLLHVFALWASSFRENRNRRRLRTPPATDMPAAILGTTIRVQMTFSRARCGRRRFSTRVVEAEDKNAGCTHLQSCCWPLLCQRSYLHRSLRDIVPACLSVRC